MSTETTGEDIAYAAQAAHQLHRAMSEVILCSNWEDPTGVRLQLEAWAKVQNLTPTERAELAQGLLSEVLHAAAAVQDPDLSQLLAGVLYGLYGYEDTE